MTVIGRLSEANAREAWAQEALNLTTWLTENLDQLADRGQAFLATDETIFGDES